MQTEWLLSDTDMTRFLTDAMLIGSAEAAEIVQRIGYYLYVLRPHTLVAEGLMH